MARRCSTLPGAPDLWTRLGWLQGSTRNGMKWGHARSTGVPSQQGAAITKGICALEAYIADDTLRHQPIGSHDCAPVTWAYGASCPAMVSSNAGLRKEDKLLYLYLIWLRKVLLFYFLF